MPTLPWTTVREASPDADVVVLASRLELGSRLRIPGFLRAAMAIRRQVRNAPGALGVSLIAQPARKTFWTLSAWNDQAALDDFVRARPHVDVMTRYRPLLREAMFRTWSTPGGSLPIPWDEAKRRLAASS